MKIARFKGFEKGFVLEETGKPTTTDNEVLVRVKCCAVSGTDSYRFREHKNPTVKPFSNGETPGHEIAGLVEGIGSSVTEFSAGDKVVVQPFWGCGQCNACKTGRENFCPDVKAFGFHVPGGFSEYLSVREDIVLKINLHSSFEEAVPTHHVAVNLNGLKSSGITFGTNTSVAVFGVGNLGLLMVMMLASMGVSKIFAVDIEESRLERARELSNSTTINAKDNDSAEVIARETNGMGVDVSIELAGGSAPTIDPAMRATKKGGTYIAIAVRNENDTFNFLQVLRKHLRIQGSATHTLREMQESLAMIEDGRVKTNRIITHRFPLEKINQAFECRLDDPKALYVMVDL
jgi:(R,R)-butanediol dehydrogenase/meso-butanediol dehydrogenase/diacetyl reductase